jgi:hypothetical protein
VDQKELLEILRISELSEVADALETELFEVKKAILAKPLLRLTLKSKLTRLAQLERVAEDQQLFRENETIPFTYQLVQSDEVLVLWETYMKAKSHWKMVFTRTQTPKGIAFVLEEGLKMEAAFAEQFRDLNWIDEEPVFGTEPDPMLVQNGLKQAAQNGWLTFAELEKNKSELEKGLLLAIKRLSLLPKYLR